MILQQHNAFEITMNQNHDTGLNQEAYLEHFLQRQNQQCNIVHQQLPTNIGEPNGKLNVVENQLNSITNIPMTPSIGFSNNMGLGIDKHQQQHNQMLALLQERHHHQQQQLMATGLLGVANNLALGSRIGNGGVMNVTRLGSSHSSGPLVDGFGANSATNGNRGPFYSTEQDILVNRLSVNKRSNGSLVGPTLPTAMGGLSHFPMHHQFLAQNPLHSDLKGNGKNFTDILLSKQAQATFLQTPKSQLPQTLRLPCGARGMKADHNSSSAYFDIPENARHGQHLLCSHPTCRAAGVKFRYCFYCKKPVTKQNFRSRHLHADLDSSNQKGKKPEGKERKNEGNTGKEKDKANATWKESNTGKSLPSAPGDKRKKTVGDGYEKESTKSLAEDCCSGEECLERPSKTQKLVDSNSKTLC